MQRSGTIRRKTLTKDFQLPNTLIKNATVAPSQSNIKARPSITEDMFQPCAVPPALPARPEATFTEAAEEKSRSRSSATMSLSRRQAKSRLSTIREMCNSSLKEGSDTQSILSTSPPLSLSERRAEIQKAVERSQVATKKDMNKNESESKKEETKGNSKEESILETIRFLKKEVLEMLDYLESKENVNENLKKAPSVSAEAKAETPPAQSVIVDAKVAEKKAPAQLPVKQKEITKSAVIVEKSPRKAKAPLTPNKQAATIEPKKETEEISDEWKTIFQSFDSLF